MLSSTTVKNLCYNYPLHLVILKSIRWLYCRHSCLIKLMSAPLLYHLLWRRIWCLKTSKWASIRVSHLMKYNLLSPPNFSRTSLDRNSTDNHSSPRVECDGKIIMKLKKMNTTNFLRLRILLKILFNDLNNKFHKL